MQLGISHPLDNELVALSRSEVRPWARVGQFLDEVERTGHWQATAASFTEWLKVLGPDLNLKEASLWRCLTAARYYQALRQRRAARGLTSPPLEELPTSVSPENLELLAKLARVVPEEELRPLEERVLAGRITRAELRKTWRAYRPALEGRTARGRGVPVPHLDPADPEQFKSRLEAQVAAAFMASAPHWLGHSIHSHEWFLHVAPETVGHARIEFDLVAVVQDAPGRPFTFHVIEIKGGNPSPQLGRLLEQQALYCDFLWVAAPDGNQSEEYLQALPDYVGLIALQGQGLRTIRAARHEAGSGLLTGELAKALLGKALAWPD